MKRAWSLAAALLLALAWQGRSDAAPYPTPPDDVVDRIRREYLSEWIRVTTPTSRYELKADEIDRSGMSGLRSRRSRDQVPQQIAWTEIERIDVRHSHTLLGTGVGAVAGGLTAAVFATYLSDQSSSVGSGAWGAVVGGVLGAWIGRNHKTENLVYLASPAIVRPATVTGGAASTDSAAALQWLGTPADSAAVVAPSTPSPAPVVAQMPPTPEVERACRALSSDDLMRIDGGFGRFAGYASTIAPSGLDGLRREPSMHSTWTQRSLRWEQVDHLDAQRNGTFRGAVRGALVTTAIAAVATGAAIALEGGMQGGEGPYLYQFVAYFGLWAIPVGTVLGGVIGAASPYWQNVYRRP